MITFISIYRWSSDLINDIFKVKGEGDSKNHPHSKQLCARYQTLMVLKEMNRGEMMLAYKTPKVDIFTASEQAQNRWLKQLQDINYWKTDSAHPVIPYIVPGTLHPKVIGKILLETKWCEPSESHWMPSMMIYRLSEKGKSALVQGLQWWKELSFGEKLTVMITE